MQNSIAWDFKNRVNIKNSFSFWLRSKGQIHKAE